jgi:MoaA/NifB/PqqE/SkfB family radical SAM enzyme
MDYGLFRSAVDQIAGDRIAGTVGFHVLGEPLLYPRIAEAVEYARGRGLDTVLTTNGSLLTPETVRNLMGAGLGTLMISLQMLDAEAHRCRESRLSFEEYYARIVAAIGQVRRESRQTEVQVVTMNTWTRRFFDVDRPMRIAGSGRDLPARLVGVFHDVYRAVGREAPRAEIERAVRRLNPLKPSYLRVDERVLLSILPFMDWGNAFTTRRVYPAHVGYCSYLLDNIGVLSNGEVTICCGDYDGVTSLGNLREHSLASLLNSEPAQALREGLERMRLVHPHCRRCFGSTNPARAVVKGLVSVGVFKLAGFRAGEVQGERRLLPEEGRTGEGALGTGQDSEGYTLRLPQRQRPANSAPGAGSGDPARAREAAFRT